MSVQAALLNVTNQLIVCFRVWTGVPIFYELPLMHELSWRRSGQAFYSDLGGLGRFQLSLSLAWLKLRSHVSLSRWALMTQPGTHYIYRIINTSQSEKHRISTNYATSFSSITTLQEKISTETPLFCFSWELGLLKIDTSVILPISSDNIRQGITNTSTDTDTKSQY